MKILKALILIFLCIALLGSDKPIIVLTAEPGHFNFHEFGEASTQTTVSVKLKIIEYTPNSEWPTGAYFGFYDANNRNNSVHFLLLRNNDSDTHAIAGYRIIENGEETEVKSISNIAIDKEVNVTMKFDNGLAVMTIDCKDPINITTKLKNVIPSVSVSSGRAYFDIST